MSFHASISGRFRSTRGLLVLAAVACSPDDARCDSLCGGATDAVVVGVWDGQSLHPIDAPRSMVYGPQGGQHFFVDAVVQVPSSGRLRLEFDFVERVTGELRGAGRWQRDLAGCDSVFTEIPIVMDGDQRWQGELTFRATLDDCQWEGDVGEVVVLPPLDDEAETDGDAGAASADAGDTSTSGDAG